MPRDTAPITLAWLKRRKACDSHCRLFAKTFGESARVERTRTNLRRAAKAGMDLVWLAQRIAPDDSTLLSRLEGLRNDAARARCAAVDPGRDAFSDLVQTVRAHACFYRLLSQDEAGLRAEALGLTDSASRLAKAIKDIVRLRNAAQAPFRRRMADALADALGLP